MDSAQLRSLFDDNLPGRDEPDAEPAEDPYSPELSFNPSTSLIGALIGMLSILVPVGSVIGDRSSMVSPLVPLPVSLSDGYQQPGRVPGTWTGPLGRRDPGREP